MRRRIALLVGGASGIGRASAIALAARGLSVAIADVDGAAAIKLAKELGDSHRGYPLDVSDENRVREVFDAVEDEVGPVAILGNFAGVSGFDHGKRSAIVEMTTESWNRTLSVNAFGTFLTIREMFRRRQSKPIEQGRIINISSMAAQSGGFRGPSSYVASKGAVLALTKVAAREAADLGITVNAIAPGVVDTPMLRSALPADQDTSLHSAPLVSRLGEPEEIASAVVYLSSVEASYITGACIDMNGGLFMR